MSESTPEKSYDPPTLEDAKRIIRALTNRNHRMKEALRKIHDRMHGPAGNMRFMQIAGPARECINITKPFLQ